MNEQFIESISSLYEQVGSIFSSMIEKYPSEVRCKLGCDDCCHACFDVSLAESLLIREKLLDLEDPKIDDLTKRAHSAKNEFKKISLDKSNIDLKTLSKARIRCPFLQPDSSCLMYEARPLTCRVYGLPTSIENKGHVCGFSGFKQGENYPTVKLDSIHAFLYDLSKAAVTNLGLSIKPDKRYFIYDIILSTLTKQVTNHE